MLTLLFDIDGTLLLTGGAGTAALKAAMIDAFAVRQPADVPVSGRTDRGIARNLFAVHAIEDCDSNWVRFRDAYLYHLEQLLPQRTGQVLPGVVELLEVVTGRTDVQVGLLTGNVRAGARLKLEYYNLHRYFAFGGFGDHHADRNAVAREALDQSRETTAQDAAEPSSVWVIGDTPLDVACARAIGARALAVATGGFAAHELAAAQPDLLLDDLSDLANLTDSWGLHEPL